MKHLLLAGGGHAHVHVLQALAREPLAAAAVTLVTPYDRQLYSGMLPGLVAGHYQASACAIPLAPLAKAAHVDLVPGSISALDTTARLATLADGRSIAYDVLSLDTGPVMDRDGLPGAREHGLFVRPIELFVQRLDGLLDQAARRAIDVVVVGAGAAGVELALALAWRLARDGSAGCRVALVSDAAQPLAGFAPAVRARAMVALRRRRVTLLNSPCVEVAAGHLRLANGARVACDLAVIALGASAPPWLAASGLALDTAGFVATGPTLQSSSHPEVFAAGDVASRSDPPHAKSGVYAVRAGPPLALNLRRFVGGGPLAPYTPQARTLYLLSLGERRAIVSWGRWSAQGGWAWHWKDHIDREFVRHYSAPIPAGS